MYAIMSWLIVAVKDGIAMTYEEEREIAIRFIGRLKAEIEIRELEIAAGRTPSDGPSDAPPPIEQPPQPEADGDDADVFEVSELERLEQIEARLRNWFNRLSIRSPDGRPRINESFRVPLREMADIVGKSERTMKSPDYVEQGYIPAPDSEWTWDGFDVLEWIEFVLDDIRRRHSFAQFMGDPRRKRWDE